MLRAHHLLALALEPVAVAFEHDDLGMVDETVDHSGDGNGVSEDLGPGREGLGTTRLGWSVRAGADEGEDTRGRYADREVVPYSWPTGVP